ncbi:dek domain-containing chromatin associated protein [Trifolium pratense]|uniref:Dek domain-containing chromatin associated protein n=1 Tax=Trifolium pratense TaxID=57577 RepID=A0A2K3PHK4_TRIPR|nr:dek domain-containing chromatin associated protein [Trifolium pratense]
MILINLSACYVYCTTGHRIYLAYKLSKRKPDDNLHMLHSILFGKKSKAHNLKRNIGQFSGYVWAENELKPPLHNSLQEKQRAKIKERIDKCVKEKLIVFCDVLNIPINKGSVKKEELSVKLLEFLEAPHATTDVLLAEKEQKAKKRTKKATPSKSPGETSAGTPAKVACGHLIVFGNNVSLTLKKQTPQSGKKRKQSSDVEEDDKAELSDAKDDSQEEEDVAVANSGSDDEVDKSEEEEDTSKARKSSSKKSVKEGSVAKAGVKTPSAKKTSAKAAKSSEKSPKSLVPKKSVADQDSASLSKSSQPATKKQKTGNEKQDTKGKTASKTSKAPVKDQVKGKSSKKSKGEPSREDMHAVVVKILKEVDFNTATLSDILRQLGTHFGLDLMHRKAEVKDIITDVINNMSDEEDGGEEDDNDGDGDDAGKDSDASNDDDAE